MAKASIVVDFDLIRTTDALVKLRARVIELETAILKFQESGVTKNMFALFELVEDI